MRYNDYQGIEIFLPVERWKHINERHPETEFQENLIYNTVSEPDFIYEGSKGELLSIKKFAKTPITENKYCIVVYRLIQSGTGFIITAYFSRRPSFKRRLKWKK
jgi:hypothetical protein